MLNGKVERRSLDKDWRKFCSRWRT